MIDAAWLPARAWRAIGSRRIRVTGHGLLVDTVVDELRQACARFGGEVVRGTGGDPCDLEMSLGGDGSLGGEGYELSGDETCTVLRAGQPHGLLYGLFHLLRSDDSPATGVFRPAVPRRMLDHWDNVDVHPVMGQVERGYAGGSLFWRAGEPRRDLARVTAYARLLAACGINAVALNNVNVHATEARLLTDRLGEVAELAGVFRHYGIRTHLAVSFAAPVLHGMSTADPLDRRVRAWWESTTVDVYATIPDFGGYLVKADSEGQPGPFTYGRSHADGANMLADALARHGGVVHWRAFVYNHRQDWRDRGVDRARAAHDHFTPHDGTFRDNVVLQVKHGPLDFQAREPVSPLIAAMPDTRIGVEFQVTQEYTGQQRHVCYLAPMWSELLRGAHGPAVADSAAEFVAVANVGDDPFWTGHPLAQANLYAFGRLAWEPGLDPAALLDEWAGLTFPGAPRRLHDALHAIMDDSWRTYERYTAPLGVGFMVRPGHHYGPDVDGYEYTPWGTYHHADRDGVGVDRTVATGTGCAGLYPKPWAKIYESPDECPDELALFFHHLPYQHVLSSGVTVIQHIYDTHFAGAREAAEMRERWAGLAGTVPPAKYERVRELLDEQVRSAEEWRDQVNTYFFRKSGVPDARGRRIY
ncbi:alpha-glucuronidase [Actinoplanes tereljensis]|uniref:Xylan alpha-(1->2)-glucuronosidase n=1 Tax=Paractinoplanes tereljensis TaxID=571912 RepID=A0A919NTJ0_9ACTN|nr:alpha-glucuronidase [Actinoplanes tereljensis]GIF23741.1 xylan alpha-(1->2)-glucuronosidase [Actinoplanes tereljensis]